MGGVKRPRSKRAAGGREASPLTCVHYRRVFSVPEARRVIAWGRKSQVITQIITRSPSPSDRQLCCRSLGLAEIFVGTFFLGLASHAITRHRSAIKKHARPRLLLGAAPKNAVAATRLHCRANLFFLRFLMRVYRFKEFTAKNRLSFANKFHLP